MMKSDGIRRVGRMEFVVVYLQLQERRENIEYRCKQRVGVREQVGEWEKEWGGEIQLGIVNSLFEVSDYDFKGRFVNIVCVFF